MEWREQSNNRATTVEFILAESPYCACSAERDRIEKRVQQRRSCALQCTRSSPSPSFPSLIVPSVGVVSGDAVLDNRLIDLSGTVWWEFDGGETGNTRIA